MIVGGVVYSIYGDDIKDWAGSLFKDEENKTIDNNNYKNSLNNSASVSAESNAGAGVSGSPMMEPGEPKENK